MQVSKNLFFVFIAVFFAFINISSAEEAPKGTIVPEKQIETHKIIYLTSYGVISHPEVTVGPGTTVIWVNQSKATIELQFEGKQITMACKSPVHFVVDEKGSFISNRIPHGAVASLCIIEKGEFNYVARTLPTTYSEAMSRPKEYKGMIVVK